MASTIGSLITITPANTSNITITGNTLFTGKVNLPATTTSAGTALTAYTTAQNIIIIWSGSITNIPIGWWVCDGTNGTPDLRGRFVLGGDVSTHKTTGGTYTTTLSSTHIPSHTHTCIVGTVSAGAHNHGGATITSGAHNHTQRHGSVDDKNFTSGSGQPPNVDSGGNGTYYTIDSTSSAHYHGIATEGTHTHTFTSDASGSGTPAPISIIPQYFSIAYIMKL